MRIGKDIDDLLHSIYYNLKNPSSFTSVDSVYKQARLKNADITKKLVKEWLSGELAYTLHKPARRRFKRNPILVENIDEQWQADLVDMQEYSKQNVGIRYILTVIDCFSKYAWAVPLKNKTAKSVQEAFKTIFKQRIPSKIQTDQGKEFENKLVQTYFKDNHILFFTAKNPDIKGAIVERFNRTLKGRMFKYFTAMNTRKYIDVLQDLVDGYNNSKHRTIRMKPVEVTSENKHVVFKNIYGFDSMRELLMHKINKNNVKPKDVVRKKYKLGPFDKSYYPLWTDPLFNVTKKVPGIKKPMFKLTDEKGVPLKRRYYSEEIQRVNPKLHRVEKVIKRRKVNGKTQYYVKWVNHPSSYNSWVDHVYKKNEYN